MLDAFLASANYFAASLRKKLRRNFINGRNDFESGFNKGKPFKKTYAEAMNFFAFNFETFPRKRILDAYIVQSS